LKITDKQKQIYNCYLKHSRKGQPYKFRKNFDDIDDRLKIDLYKLQNFFNKFKHIDIDFFFESFSFVYPNDQYPILSFFTTRKAIKCYSLYKEYKENLSPDLQLDEIKKSIVHIGSFCLRNKIQMKDFLKHKTLCIPTWVLEYKESKINIYSVIALGYSNDLYQMEEDERDIMIPGLLKNIESYKIRFNNCNSKEKIKTWILHTDNFIKKNLTLPK
jgi:hypothetical protein